MGRFFSLVHLLFLSWVSALSVLAENDNRSPIAEKESAIVVEASKILEAYHGGVSNKGERKLHLICWRPNDREYPTDNAERLTRIMKHIQAFYADEMERIGFGRRTIQLDYDEDGLLVIHHAVGSAPFIDYKKPEGERVRRDCWPVLKAAGLDPDNETIVIFTNLSDWDPVKNTFVHKSPYYARGNNKNGLAWQLASPELDTKNLKLKKPMIKDGEYGRISLGKHNTIFIGGIAHELGHGLGLPHCRARDDEASAYGTALMGSGNRTYFDELRGEGKGTFLTLAHALRLASHPQFSGSVKGMEVASKATFSDMKVKNVGSRFAVSGRVGSSIPVYALIAYLDPDGGGDYDSRTVCTVPSPDGNFYLDCHPMVKAKKADIRIVALMANGSTSTWRSSYEVSDKGVPDISLMRVSIELSDFVDAVYKNQLNKAKILMANLHDDSRSRTVAEAVFAGKNPNRTFVSLGELKDRGDRIWLSQVRPDEVSVGWGSPSYDFIPRPEILLIARGRLHTSGIYAHAPARHVYSLPKDHVWKTLKGVCGLPDQRGGSVIFRIKTNGKEVFKTSVVEPGASHSYEIDLTGITKLELLVEDGGDGKARDWGYWFDPELLR